MEIEEAGAWLNMVLLLPMLAFYLRVIDAGVTIGPNQEQPKSPGCHLNLNNGHFDLEPIGDPLLIHSEIRVFHFRDIPDSGGSFSVDYV